MDAARPERRAELGRTPLLVAMGLIALVAAALATPRMNGDGQEYLATLEAWVNHGTPDVRAQDVDGLRALVGPNHADRITALLASGLYEAKDGRKYALHFWVQPLSAVPAKLALRLLGGNQLAALQVTNVAFVLLAGAFVLLAAPWSAAERYAFLALAAVGPMVWHLRWASAEVFSWSLAVVSIVVLARRRYGWAAFAAGLGATQNPPLLFLAVCVTALSVRERSARTTAAALLGSLVAALPMAFYVWAYGTPNLIAAHGGADARLISLHRIWSFLFDLNQGLAMAAPGLVVVAAIGAVEIFRRRSWDGAAMLCTASAMIAACCTTTNWNAGGPGVQRYVVWIVPLLALIAVRSWPRHASPRWLATAAAANLAVCYAGTDTESYVQHGALATFVLSNAPRLYNPEPEIFAERTSGAEVPLERALPVAFVSPRGGVTKILLDPARLDDLPERFVVAPEYLASVRRAVGCAPGLVYLHPPAGAVTFRRSGTARASVR